MAAKTLYWLQGAGCGGDTWSLFNLESPDILELFVILGIEVLWHPAISTQPASDLAALNRRIFSGQQDVDILCVEGSILCGPSGSGMADTVMGQPKKELAEALARRAGDVVAVGTCASFGGFGGGGETEAIGMQFVKSAAGGLLGEGFRSRNGRPVINLPGCPCHCDALSGALAALVDGPAIRLNEYNAPLDWYGIMVHQGCTRNEYHEYRVEEKRFGEKGCLFFYMGCHAPLAYGSCNKVLWNRRSSKTRVGVPCFGCTHPDFPQAYPFFMTKNIEGIPIELPAGVSRAHYLAYKGMAAAAAPKRLIERKSGI